MIVVDRNGTIAAFSRAAQDLLGHDAATMIGRSIDPLVSGGWPAVLTVADGEGSHAARMIAADGAVVPVALSVSCLPGTERAGYALFFIPAREGGTMDEGRTRDVAMAEFAAQMMHELNQPLAAASNFLAVAQKLAARPSANADVGEIIDMALHQIQRMGEIVRATWQKAAGERMKLRPIPVRDAIAEAVTLVQVASDPRAIAIVADVQPKALRMVVDPTGIQQVLTNLLRNAVEAFGPIPPDGARIDVTARRVGDRQVALSISDNGPGIAPAMMSGLFEAFGHRDRRGGLGLGLSICRTIVEGHDGSLTAENRVGGGACFTVTLASRRRMRPD